MWRALVVGLVIVGCGDNTVPDARAPAALRAAVVAELPADGTLSIAALDRGHVVVARATVSGDALCPDCVDLDPSQCPAACMRTGLTVSVLDTATGIAGAAVPVVEVFPASFDHGVNAVDVVALGGDRIGLGWLDCDNSRCGAFASKQRCTARYTVVDLATGTAGPIATLYEDRFARLQLVANPRTREVLAVTGMPYGAFGTGVRAAVFDDTGAARSPWLAIGGRDALSPAAAATGAGFAIAVDDRRPTDAPPAEPCAASCDCGGIVNVDPERGGLYVYEVDAAGISRVDPVAIGLADDGHLAGGHYHAREVLAVMDRAGELVIAAGQAIDMEAELFVGRHGTWTVHAGFDSPIPLWIGVLGSGDTAAWIGSQPQGGQATFNTIVAGAATSTAIDERALTEPLDSHVFETAPVVTPAGIPATFVLRGVFGDGSSWKNFDIVEVAAE